MKIINKNLKQGMIKVKPETIDDLWSLSLLLNEGDIISGKTIRKISLGDKSNEKTKTIKKTVFLKIKLEKILFNNSLKLLGIILEGPEDIPHGSHHSFTFYENDEIKIEKKWLNFQLKKIYDLEKKQDAKVIACIYNREEAHFAKLEQNKFKIISKINGDVEKKGDDSNKNNNFFKEIVNNIGTILNRYGAKNIIYASSHFWKKNLEKNMPQEMRKISIFVPINDCSEKGFSEILTRPEMQKALSDQQAIKDAKLVEEIFSLIAKEKEVAYGFNDTKKAAEMGAIKTLICTEEFISKKREETDKNPDAFKEVELLLELTESNNGEIRIITGKGEHVQKLDGLGGISAILRFRLEI